MSIAPPHWTVTWDLFAWMGHRRFARHWSVPQIRAELADTYDIKVSSDLIEKYIAKYEVMVAAREGDVDSLVEQYRDVEDLVLSIDGLQPEKGHECLYVVRELNLRRVWFAEPLLSSAAAEIQLLFERAKQIADRIGKPIRCWITDKQAAFVSGVAAVFPGVIHRYCANHFLRDLAKPVLEADSHAKVQMRRKVRGLRDIERQVFADRRAAESSQASEPATTTESVDPESGHRQGSQPADDRVPSSAPTSSTVMPSSRAPKSRSDDSLSERGSQRESVQAASPSSEAGDVVLDYCAAVRGILNDNRGGPLRPPGLRMAEALKDVRDSIGRCATDEKRGTFTLP